ncbi:hypothetical protein [Teredinibacter purpureus]|uniref:hypothetical protein n=1 Tax=Teredinibacter purpureus TaxID=2731756 RepID=UPI0005F8435F|nr:hypothetical protein [Teredinibacter purpureus]
MTDKTALAFCESKDKTICFVIANNIPTNVSRIENANLGKLGLAGKEQYEKIETFPSEWVAEKQNGNLISFTTRAWRNGQRYTASGPVFVKNDGVYVHQ